MAMVDMDMVRDLLKLSLDMDIEDMDMVDMDMVRDMLKLNQDMAMEKDLLKLSLDMDTVDIKERDLLKLSLDIYIEIEDMGMGKEVTMVNFMIHPFMRSE